MKVLKLLPVAVAVAVVGVTGLTIWIGARVREDTVVERPYEEGLRYDEQRRARMAAHEHGHETLSLRPFDRLRVSGPHDPAVSGDQPPGERKSEPEASAEGARATACDLGAGPCTRALGDLALTAALGPRPLAAMRSLSVNVELREAGAPVSGADVTISFAMPGMPMGANVVALAPSGAGRYAGTAVLVRCPSGRRDWTATVEVRRGGATAQRAELPLRLGE